MFNFLKRHTRVALFAMSFAFVSLVTVGAWAEFVVPSLTSPVVDGAAVLSPSTVAELENVLRRIRESGGPQINVLTVQSLEGLPIENASIKVTDAWKLGGQKADDGVLFLISMGDRKMRIEVGQGLEGVLTDAESKRIIEDRVLPYFRAGRAGDGIVVGVRSILEKTAPDALKALGEAPTRAREGQAKGKRSGGGLPFPVLIILFLFVMFAGGRRGRRSGLMGALAGAALGSSSRGGWSGRGGGGGWSGGGGGFSGGGASGSW